MEHPIPQSQEDQVALLLQRVDESGLSLTKFSELVLLRDARTVRRWVAKDSPIPHSVLEFVANPWRSPYPTRSRPARAPDLLPEAGR